MSRPRCAIGGRQRCREAVDDPKRWRAVLRAIDKQLEEGDTSGFEALFRHGYGAPPQALDVKTSLNIQESTFVCHFADGVPVFADAEAVSKDALN